MKRNPETVIMIEILDALSSSGRCLIWRNASGGLHTSGGAFMRFGLGIGSPDLVGVLIPSGRFIAAEIKTQTGRLTPEQLAWHRAATAAGAAVTCVRSVDDALAWLASL